MVREIRVEDIDGNTTKYKMKNEWVIGSANKSFIFILPMLGGRSTDYVDTNHPRKQFKNCFVGDTSREDLKDKILLLYEFSGKKDYLSFEEALKSHEYYDSMYEPDKYHTMYVFNIPDEFKASYDKYMDGGYSKFSDKYKKTIKQFHNLSDENLIIHILYKNEIAFLATEKKLDGYIKIPRTQEAISIPDWNIEYYGDDYRVKDRKILKNLEED